jgi:hypothetical protein
MVIYKESFFYCHTKHSSFIVQKAGICQDSIKRITPQNKGKTFLIPPNCETNSTGNYSANRN